MQRYEEHLSYLLETYTWGLLPTHFHFEVKMRPEEHSIDFLKRLDKKTRTKTEMLYLQGELNYNTLTSRAFKRFFQAYTESVNNHLRRKGSLFSRQFRRIEILNDEQFKKIMLYIHTNPVKHGITRDFRDYKWTSWESYMTRSIPKHIIDEAYDLFGNKQAFIAAHEVQQSNILDRNFDFF